MWEKYAVFGSMNLVWVMKSMRGKFGNLARIDDLERLLNTLAEFLENWACKFLNYYELEKWSYARFCSSDAALCVMNIFFYFKTLKKLIWKKMNFKYF